MTNDEACELIRLLKKIPNANNYDGDYSIQVQIKLSNGDILRIGLTDEDVAAKHGLWFDLNYKLGNIKG